MRLRPVGCRGALLNYMCPAGEVGYKSRSASVISPWCQRRLHVRQATTHLACCSQPMMAERSYVAPVTVTAGSVRMRCVIGHSRCRGACSASSCNAAGTSTGGGQCCRRRTTTQAVTPVPGTWGRTPPSLAPSASSPAKPPAPCRW